MKEEWLKDIHSQMSDYEVDEPEDLWEQIQLKVSEEKNKRNRTMVLLWTKRLVAIAAMVILFLSINHYLDREKNSSATADVLVEKFPKQEDSVSQSLNTSFSTQNEYIFIEKNTIQNTSEGIEDKSAVIAKEALQNKSNIDASKVVLINNPQVVSVKTNIIFVENLKDEFQSPINGEELPEIAQIDTNNKDSKRISLGVFTSGGMGASSNSKSANEATRPGIGPGKSTWKDSPLLGALVFNQGQEIETKTKHQLPIRVGFLFNYEINNRFGIESGITYAILTSDIRIGNENHYFTNQQQLHFVGIPVKFKCKMFAARDFDLYSSLGILSEKNVSGELKKTYSFDNQITQTENEKIRITPWQWSVNTSLGMQYNFSPHLGIYAEPGVSYFFRNSSSVETIYTDKPFNFNFNLGLRFSFGR